MMPMRMLKNGLCYLLWSAALAASTALADITLNDALTFATDGDTRFTLDGVTVSEAQARAIGPGLVARVDVGSDVSADFSSGTALTVALDNLLKGPVTSINPLTVLRQVVVVTGDTVLADVPGNNVEQLRVGDVVEVSGFADVDNSVRATRVEYKPNGAPVWKLTGVAGDVSSEQFTIGAQAVALAGVAPRDCDSGFTAGRLVEVKASANTGFRPGDPLTMVTDIECQTPGLVSPPGVAIPAQVEGLVTALLSADEFVVNGQRVRTTPATVYRNGSADDIAPGVRLQAQGVLDADAGILTAARIEFRFPRVRIEAPASAADIVDGEAITLLGITALATAQTRDEDGILSGGLTASRQVEVRGFRDRNGQVIATRVRERGDPDRNNVRLRGPIAVLDPPRFEILGVTIDTRASALPVNFFSSVSVGLLVQIEDARYDPTTRTLSGGRVEIEQPSISTRGKRLSSSRQGTRAVAGTGIGTVTRINTGDLSLFSDGFEDDNPARR